MHTHNCNQSYVSHFVYSVPVCLDRHRSSPKAVLWFTGDMDLSPKISQSLLKIHLHEVSYQSQFCFTVVVVACGKTFSSEGLPSRRNIFHALTRSHQTFSFSPVIQASWYPYLQNNSSSSHGNAARVRLNQRVAFNAGLSFQQVRGISRGCRAEIFPVHGVHLRTVVHEPLHYLYP